MGEAIPDWLLLALGALADLAVFYGAVRLAKRFRRRRGPPPRGDTEGR